MKAYYLIIFVLSLQVTSSPQKHREEQQSEIPKQWELAAASSICSVFFFLMNTIWMEAAGPFLTAQVGGVKNTVLSR